MTIAAVVVAAQGCGVAGVVERGPAQFSASALAKPFVAADRHRSQALARLSVSVSPAAAVAVRYVPASVVSDELSGAEPSTLAHGQTRRLTLQVGTVAVHVDYGAVMSQALLPKGTQVQVRYYTTTATTADAAFADAIVRDDSAREVFIVSQRRRGQPDLRVGGVAGWAFIIRDPAGRLLVALFSGTPTALSPRGQTPTAMAPGVMVRPVEGVAYESVEGLPSGCQSVVTHRGGRLEELWPRGGLEVGPGQRGARFDGHPGSWRPVLVHGRRYRWVLHDASDGPPGRCPGQERAGHFSFALIAEGT